MYIALFAIVLTCLDCKDACRGPSTLIVNECNIIKYYFAGLITTVGPL